MFLPREKENERSCLDMSYRSGCVFGDDKTVSVCYKIDLWYSFSVDGVLAEGFPFGFTATEYWTGDLKTGAFTCDMRSDEWIDLPIDESAIPSDYFNCLLEKLRQNPPNNTEEWLALIESMKA